MMLTRRELFALIPGAAFVAALPTPTSAYPRLTVGHERYTVVEVMPGLLSRPAAEVAQVLDFEMREARRVLREHYRQSTGGHLPRTMGWCDSAIGIWYYNAEADVYRAFLATAGGASDREALVDLMRRYSKGTKA